MNGRYSTLKTKRLNSGWLKKTQDSRRKDIKQSIFKSPFKPDESKVVFGKIDEHIRLSRVELKNHLDKLNDHAGFKVDDHQPIFYFIKLRNALVDSN